MKLLPVRALTKEAFAAFGDVIEMSGKDPAPMNQGMAERYHALAEVEAIGDGAKAVISLVHSTQYPLPHIIKLVERHPLGSQSFIPLDTTPFFVVVAPAGENFDVAQLQAFKTNGQQGINYHRGVWHGPLCTPFAAMDLICVDRDGGGNNCEELLLEEESWLQLIDN